VGCGVAGCTDSTACGYNADATIDDGSCYTAAAGEDCDGNCLAGYTLVDLPFDYDNYYSTFSITSCDGSTVLTSISYSYSYSECLMLPEEYIVTVDDPYGYISELGWAYGLSVGDAVYSESGSVGCGVLGCTDSTACGYNADATIDDGSCYTAADGFDCDGNCLAGSLVSMGGGSWIGETSWEITNCDGTIFMSGDGAAMAATCVELPDAYTVSIEDSYGDGWNGNNLVVGSTSYTLINDGATDDGISAVYTVGECSGIEGCADSNACNYDSAATVDNGTCEYPVNACTACDGTDLGGYDCNNVCGGDAVVDECGECGGSGPAAGFDCDGNCLGTIVSMTAGSFLSETSWTISTCDGSLIATASGNQNGTNVDYTVCVDLPENYTLTMSDSYGDGWNGNYLTIDGTEYNGPSADLGPGDEVMAVVGDCPGISIPGCTDEGATNFDQYANEDDDSCEFCPIVGGVDITTQTGVTCYNYVMNLGYTIATMEYYGYDCTCVVEPTVGCDDTTACNYNIEADSIDNLTCEYPATGYDCDGECLADADGDGVCDDFDLCPNDAADACAGCTDELATNYSAAATSDDGSCFFGVTCDGSLSSSYDYVVSDDTSFAYQVDSDGVAQLWISGSTDSTWGDDVNVYNGAGTLLVSLSGTFSQLVTSDDNGVTIEFDTDSFGTSGTTSWVVSCVGGPLVYGCTDEDACNYDAANTDDDGSCTYAASGYDCDGNLTCEFPLTTISYDDSGSWEYENAWQILDADGNIIWTSTYSTSGVNSSNVSISPVSHNGLTADFCLDPEGCYTFNLYDTFGDGWNGNSLDAGAFGTFTITAGNFFSGSNCVYECELSEVAVSWTNIVDVDGNVIEDGEGFGFAITDNTGTPVASGGYDFDGTACLDLENFCYSLSLSSEGGDGFGSNVTLSVGDSLYVWTDGTSGSYSSNFDYIMGSGCPQPGCVDIDACNYVGDDELDNYFAGPFGTCEYPDTGYDCDGVCLEDADGDSVCDAFDVCPDDADDACAGCTNPNYSNYDAEATVDDGSCYYSVSCQLGLSDSYLYVNNDDTVFNYQSNVGSYLAITISGATEVFFDDVTVLNGAGDVLAVYEGIFSGTFVSDDNGIQIVFDSDSSVNPTDGNIGADTAEENAPTTWTLSCVTDVPGCIDATACNYDEAAVVDNGFCEYPDYGYGCDGECLADTDEDGLCDLLDSCPDDATDSCLGCTDGGDLETGAPAACNYDADATVDNGTCFYAVAGYDCEGACLADADADGICDEFDVCPDDATDACYGCMDQYACNYSETATIDSEDCNYAVSGYDCEGNFTCTFELTTISYVASGSWSGENSWTISDENGTPIWSSSYYGDLSADLCMDPEACYTFSLFDSFGDGWNGNSLDAGAFNLIDTNDNGTPGNTSDDFDEPVNYTSFGGPIYEATNCVEECELTEISVSWLFASEGEGFSIYDLEGDVVVTGDNTFDGVACIDPSGCYNLDLVPPASSSGFTGAGNGVAIQVGDEVFEYTDGSNGIWSSIFTYAIGTGCPIPGCMELDACNYDSSATEDDGSCTYPVDCETCEDGVIVSNDADGDGVCDSDEVLGCTDLDACNYDSSATDTDSSCVYADGNCESCLDGGVTVNDSDSDGICDSDEVAGCQDSMACNYNPNATDEGSCEYTDGVYDCDGVTCLNDTDGDGVCDQNEVSGCTDSSASNYSDVATDEDGTCIYPVPGCTDPSAGNFDPDAGVNDGSCDFGPFDVVATDCNMTVLLPGDLDITVEGEALVGSIWIGVLNSNGDAVGSALYTSGETNSIAVFGAEAETGDTPGMAAGESLNFVVMVGDEMLSAAVSYSFGAGTWSCNGLSGLSSFAATSVVVQMIELNNGWNIWSTYVDPENADMEAMFSAIVDDVVIIKDENGSVYWPEFGLNNIGNISDAAGYQAKLAADQMLEVTGQMLDPNMSFNLEEGWGIIGYVKPDPSDAVEMMSPVVDDLVIMKDENGSVYWPEFGLNNIGNMQAGEGYQVKMLQDAMFAYTSGTGRFGYTEDLKTIHYDAPQNTGSNMTIGLPASAWDVMPAIGDEIAAYDESGRLIGSTLFSGDNIALTVWGDDLTTTAKDGLAIGEKVTFKLWSSNMNTESTLAVTKWDAGSDVYAVDGISIASNIVISESASANSYKLYQNVPNPFNGTTTVKFYVPESSEVTIGVYNMLGEFVAEVTNDIYNAGKHEVEFNSNDLGQGTYFVTMTTDSFTATKNMNIVK
jgi:hypothetical protein